MKHLGKVGQKLRLNLTSPRDMMFNIVKISCKKTIDPENHIFLMETNLPTPTTGRVELSIYWRVRT